MVGIVFINLGYDSDMKKIKKLDWHYFLYDKEYIREQLDSPYFKKFAREEVKFLTEKLQLKRGMSLLEGVFPCFKNRISKTRVN